MLVALSTLVEVGQLSCPASTIQASAGHSWLVAFCRYWLHAADGRKAFSPGTEILTSKRLDEILSGLCLATCLPRLIRD